MLMPQKTGMGADTDIYTFMELLSLFFLLPSYVLCLLYLTVCGNFTCLSDFVCIY